MAVRVMKTPASRGEVDVSLIQQRLALRRQVVVLAGALGASLVCGFG
tara:strand:+ start:450 stop:590 length:141 start_codon:yes stop_codon:yes gene_type:complete